MPRTALVVCAVWFFTLFVLRSWVQWRRTGSTGIRAGHRFGTAAWWAAFALMIGLGAAVLAPVAALRGWPGGALQISNEAVHWTGALLAVLGNAGGLLAQLSMGDSWRIGVDPDETTALVTGGWFAWVRNPIFSFVGLSAVGLVLLVPNALALTACLLTILAIEAQVREVEEPYLEKTHGRDYAEYAERVGRFLPGFGRLRRPGDGARHYPSSGSSSA